MIKVDFQHLASTYMYTHVHINHSFICAHTHANMHIHTWVSHTHTLQMERKMSTECEMSSDVVTIIPAHRRRLRQEDGQFEASSGYIRTLTQTQ